MTAKRKIPSTMVSQHPDHASVPYWHTQAFIATQFEIKEAYLSFSELGVSEYKWDWEGKYVDESVIEKFLSEYESFFTKNQIGRDKFLTFRLPNPRVESEFRLGRAFMGLLSASALTSQFKLHDSPLFEVILPMTQSAQEMIDIQLAFSEMTQLKHKLYRMEKTPLKHIEIIPLFEDIYTVTKSADILEEYVKLHQKEFGFKPSYIRPYVARSDPALNSGLIPTVLAIKIALSDYLKFEEKFGIELFPIIGSASLPFRGHLSPINVDQFINEYKGIKTALLQSAFRYDYPKVSVTKAIKKLENKLPKNQARPVSDEDREELLKTFPIFEKFYRESVEKTAKFINQIASLLPKRRERVQHIGLFGYSRGVGKVKLPRAITFTGSLYSIGIPPEIIGTGRGIKYLKDNGKIDLLEKYYLNVRHDLIQAGRYLNKKVLKELSSKSSSWKGIEQDIIEIESYLGVSLEPLTKNQKDHQKLTSKIYSALESKKPVTKLLEQAAILRQSLG